MQLLQEFGAGTWKDFWKYANTSHALLML